MTDTPDDLTPDVSDDHNGYDSEVHAWALRLVLATLRKDWAARDDILNEIGECLGCLTSVITCLAAETATAYVGPPETTPEGFRFSKDQEENAIGFISDILADVLDHQPEKL